MVRQLELIDTFLATGREEFTFEEAKAALGRSSAATANALRQLNEKGLVDRLTRGHYAIRPLGSLSRNFSVTPKACSRYTVPLADLLCTTL